MKKKIIYILTAIVIGFPASVFAAVPGFINFQGRLLDASKLPKNVPVSMIFRICDTLAGACSAICQSGNTCLWTETQTVDVSNGIFAVQLGSFTELTAEVFSSASRYLEIKVEGETLSPREQLAAGPYSFRASVADSLDAANLTGTAQVNHGGTGLTGGTSGGVPYYSGAAAITSSAELTHYNLLIGGGAGAAPYALGGLGTLGQVLTSNDAGANPSWQAVPTQTSALLSATHPDTLADTVVRGDVMIGNSTPKWARLAKGAQYTSLNMGANDPAWGAIALDQSAAVSGILAAGNGGTGSGFTEFAGPAAAKKTFTLPNASSTILTTNAAVTVGQGGTGLSGGTSGGVPYYSGAAAITSSAELTHYNLLIGGGAGAAPYALGSLGVSGQVLTSNDAGANPSWQAVPAQTSALLSATHTDTLAASVVQGDIMIGNSTPKWARLAKGAQYTSLNMGANDPAWGAIALDQSAAVSGILAAGNGGTGSGFTEFAKKTFTLPNASSTILTTNAAVTVGQGGTGLSGGTSGGVPYYSGAAAMTSSSELTQYNVLLGGGAGAAPYALGSIGVSSQVLTSNGSGNPSWKDPLVMTVSLDADAASNSTTNLVDITGLDTTVGVGTYVFQYFIRYQSSAATTGVKFAVNHTGAVSTFITFRRWVDLSATASTNAPDQSAVIAAGHVMGSAAVRAKNTALGVSLSVDTINADMLMIIEGLMIVTASGDLQLLHGSETANATTVKAGTSLILTKTR